MPTIDPVAAAQDAIAAYFADAIEGMTCRRGWPEANVSLDLASGPLLTVTPGPVERTPTQPIEVDREDSDDGALLVTYRVAWVRIRAQLDLWAAHRSKRDDMAALVEAALDNDMPRAPGLTLTSSSYHGRRLHAVARALTPQDSADGAPRGEWRQTWELTIDTDIVARATLPATATIEFETTTDLGGTEITDTTSVP